MQNLKYRSSASLTPRSSPSNLPSCIPKPCAVWHGLWGSTGSLVEAPEQLVERSPNDLLPSYQAVLAFGTGIGENAGLLHHPRNQCVVDRRVYANLSFKLVLEASEAANHWRHTNFRATVGLRVACRGFSICVFVIAVYSQRCYATRKFNLTKDLPLAVLMINRNVAEPFNFKPSNF